MQTVADIVIRPQADEDYEAMARIHRAVYPDWPVTAAEVREHMAEIDPARFVHVGLVAEDRASGEVVAAASYHQLPWSFHPDRFRTRLNVHPAWQGRGIGRALMERMLSELRARGARWVKAYAREDYARSIAFVAGFGFREYARSFESRLDVAQMDLPAFADYARSASELGITITTLSDELRQHPDCLPAVYEMHCILDMGAPRDDPGLPTPPTYADYRRGSIDSPMTLLDGYFLAKFGEVYVGESVLKRSDADPTWLHQELTGVIPECRGRGIATALKLRTVEYAQTHGHRIIQTWNSSKNGPMLAINGKLGFQRQPAWVEFQLEW
ncbi:MAG TPA: GNAT family N-acetyltransferase [bacterium]|nr:GNAT family N-acetyltransferase [bacterium]